MAMFPGGQGLDGWSHDHPSKGHMATGITLTLVLEPSPQVFNPHWPPTPVNQCSSTTRSQEVCLD